MTLSLCFDGPGDHRDLHVLTHSFTTRRSSDLPTPLLQREGNDLLPEYPTARDGSVAGRRFRNNRLRKATLAVGCRARQLPINSCRSRGNWPMARCRSEEHTSELQSLMRTSYAVFCMTKKKKQQRTERER